MEKEKIIMDVKKKGVRFVELQFVDIFGTAKMCEIPAERLEDTLENGLWFDGSSIEGFVRIYESDMFLLPDPNTYAILPWTDGKVARLICDVYVDEKTAFEGDPRYVLRKMMKKARENGFEYKVGPELEFFLFKNSEGSAPLETHDDAGYFDLGPRDLATNVRKEVASHLETMGLKVEMSHHEVAPGQHEIDFRYGDALTIADYVLTYKTTVKMIAKKYGLYASFMPKPIFGMNGSGMHIHQSLWKGGKNAFFDNNEEYNLSSVAKSFIAGQLAHARALSAVLAPTVNSYKRLVPGYEAPVYICWGRINRSALIRVPKAIKKKESESTRCELRCPDPSTNPYLAFAVMLAAGLDGIVKNMKLPEPVEENVYPFDDEKLKKKYIKSLPGSLGEAIEELKNDKVIRDALGTHIFEKLTKAQEAQWNEYKAQVTEWEIKKYFPIL